MSNSEFPHFSEIKNTILKIFSQYGLMHLGSDYVKKLVFVNLVNHLDTTIIFWIFQAKYICLVYMAWHFSFSKGGRFRLEIVINVN